ncbi:MAG: hypothetical protein HQK79_14175 [Desulfobacterales bacterium]|nr:hypothetical protein [Desulfobacterales bacterium]
MQINFITNKPALDGSYNVNLYLISEAENGRPALRKTPGHTLKVTPDEDVEVRGMVVMGEYLYAVCGNTFYKIDLTFTATSLGTLNSSTGKVWIVASDTSIMIVDNGGDGYYYNSGVASLTQITDADFPSNVNSVTFQDGYFIVTKTDTNDFYISAIDNPASWAVADTDEVEGDYSYLKGVISVNRRLLFLAEKSMQWYYNSGNADFPFEPIGGSYQDLGIFAPNSPALLDSSVYFLDSKKRVVRTAEFSYQVISTEQINKKISSYAHPETAIGYGLHWQGHIWYVIVFPDDDITWVYDVTTENWHQWASGVDEGRHRSNCYVFWQEQNKHLIGDYANGNICELDNSYTDNGSSILWQRTSGSIYQDNKRIVFNYFQADVKTGTGLISGHGIDNLEPPYCILQWSDDDGRTWSNEHWGSYGKIGEYKTRVKFNRLGVSRRRIFRLKGTEDTEFEIYGAFLEAQMGRN